MRIIIEGHQYPAEDVNDVLDGITNLRDVEGKVSVNYVGYYYNPKLRDCVFILPKVLLEDVNGEELVFGHCKPEKIIHLEAQKELPEEERLTTAEQTFIYELSVWIYRAIVIFHETHEKSDIVLKQNVQQMAKGRLRRKHNTFLDILLAIQKFNRENQDFFFFILRNLHSGYNKINWTKTISHSEAFIQDGTPVYLNPVNKKRQINFDEELLIIFFSILHYINKEYGFPVTINVNFPLITGQKFDKYRKGFGRTRLLQIKYKYFSDKALYLWELCYAFFEQSKQVNIDVNEREYLLVKNFNIVFEAIIDNLVGDNNIPAGLKAQEDGKRVDHIYTYRSLTNNDDNKQIYYIGDSKYYKRGNPIGKESVYKQFTYARNVIQWNLNLFMDNDPDDETLKSDRHNFGKVPKLRDEITEGYNIIPNFFISAKLNKDLSYVDTIASSDKKENRFCNRQFENRLFDRDTLLVSHYDVNFLYVVSLYARNNVSQKSAWKDKVREMFRTEIQALLKEKYKFYAMTPREGVNAEEFLKENFQQLLGKVYTPYNIEGSQSYYSLALDNDKKYNDENDLVLALIEPGFYYKECPLGEDPRKVLPKIAPSASPVISPSLLTMHFIERYSNQHFLIGCYHSDEQLAWIMGKNDKGTNLYNVRLKRRGDTVRDGALPPTYLEGLDVKFVILYKYGEENTNEYRVFHVHHHATMNEERMRKALYPNPKGNYFCFVFDEEVQLSQRINLIEVIASAKKRPDYVVGMPIFKTGEELMNCVK